MLVRDLDMVFVLEGSASIFFFSSHLNLFGSKMHNTLNSINIYEGKNIENLFNPLKAQFQTVLCSVMSITWPDFLLKYPTTSKLNSEVVNK